MPQLRIRYSFDEPNYIWFWARWICFTAAASCFVWGAISWVEQRWYQAEAREAFERVKDADVPKSELPSHKNVGAPLARLDIARLNVSGYVQDGFDARTLRRSIGHAPRSAMPGQRGNVILAAHRDTFFAGLSGVRLGDIANLQAPGGAIYRYKVSRVFVVDREESWVMRSKPDQNMLTLITCYPFHFMGNAPQRLVVLAEELDPSDSSPRRSLRLTAHRM